MIVIQASLESFGSIEDKPTVGRTEPPAMTAIYALRGDFVCLDSCKEALGNYISVSEKIEALLRQYCRESEGIFSPHYILQLRLFFIDREGLQWCFS